MTDFQQMLSKPFLLVQVGDYGESYQKRQLPLRLSDLADEMRARGQMSYPVNTELPPPHYCVPSDVDGILMNKADECALNGFAYWAQSLSTCVDPNACFNSSPEELYAFAETVPAVNVLFVRRLGRTNSPKGAPAGTLFERWTPLGYRAEAPTAEIDQSIVYTEAGKATLVMRSMDVFHAEEKIDLRDFHVFFTPSGPHRKSRHLHNERLPFRSSNICTCSLLSPGCASHVDGFAPLRAAMRQVVATGTLHDHLCGRVLQVKKDPLPTTQSRRVYAMDGAVGDKGEGKVIRDVECWREPSALRAQTTESGHFCDWLRNRIAEWLSGADDWVIGGARTFTCRHDRVSVCLSRLLEVPVQVQLWSEGAKNGRAILRLEIFMPQGGSKVRRNDVAESLRSYLLQKGLPTGSEKSSGSSPVRIRTDLPHSLAEAQTNEDAGAIAEETSRIQRFVEFVDSGLRLWQCPQPFEEE